MFTFVFVSLNLHGCGEHSGCYLKHINSLHRQAILEHFGAFLLIYYLPGIGLLYFAGVIAAWVVKGFRPQGTE